MCRLDTRAGIFVFLFQSCMQILLRDAPFILQYIGTASSTS